ncbi:hypothetical protein H4R34_000202 [Dimargaris verticillata]|uniref:Zinc finger Mcm10/DnaG-type domain-containing protein n=1 Tax=Dimargaris verticillata TaxID=2761393 RepID=A0A9W8B8K5_9FUNG|nr:hypothetical protein H4R34_000202 [Dimargaris verticillata]
MATHDATKPARFLERMRALRQARYAHQTGRINATSTANDPQASNDQSDRLQKILTWTDERVEPYSGLGIRDRRLTLTEMNQRMAAHRLVPLRRIGAAMVRNRIEGDWVTIGVVWEIGAVQTAKNGGRYCTVKLTDLAENSLNLILFDDSLSLVTEPIAIPCRTVVAIFSPTVLKRAERHAVPGLAVNHTQQILAIGTSRDFSHCNARQASKKPCPVPISRHHGQLCARHLELSLQQLKSSRMEFSTGTSTIQLIDPSSQSVRRSNPAYHRKPTQTPGTASLQSNPFSPATAMYETPDGSVVQSTAHDEGPADQTSGCKRARVTTDHAAVREYIMEQGDAGARYIREAKRHKEARAE